MSNENLYAAGLSVAVAADEYAKAVTEAVRRRRGEVVRLINARRGAETLADAARIEVQLAIVQRQYEEALMTETRTMLAHNDQLAALGCNALAHRDRV